MANMTVRLLAPAKQTSGVKHVSGQVFNDAPGAVVDYADHIAQHLEGNGYIRVAFSGPTSARPAYPGNRVAPPTREFFVDTTLGKVIMFDGLVWRDPITGASV